jgi:alpha-L-rhamnosidase
MTDNTEEVCDPRGPIVHPGMVVRVDESGVQAPGYRFTNSHAKKDAWTAKWIWLAKGKWRGMAATSTHWIKSAGGSEKTQMPVMALFRKEITLSEEPLEVAAWVSADVRYRIFINGRLAGRGPVDIGGDYRDKAKPRHWFYDSCDLTGYFHKGPNVIAAEVSIRNMVMSEVTTGKAGFLFEADIKAAGGESVKIASDMTWRGMPGDAYVATNVCDAGREPAGWMRAGFDDWGWPKACELCNADSGRWKLMASEIPPLMEARYMPRSIAMTRGDVKEMASGISISGQGSYRLDFDREITGYVNLKADGQAGAEVTISQNEMPEGKPQRLSRYILRDGLQFHEVHFLGGFQYLMVEVKGNVRALEVGATFASYPVEYKGSFECSDQRLSELWRTCRWTNQLCMQSYYLDSPIHQEPIGCTGDYMIESLINYHAFGDRWLTRQDLRKTAMMLRKNKYDMFHTSYSLLWVQMLRDYYEHTADVETVNELAVDVHKLLKLFGSYVGETGLITEAPDYMFMDWVGVEGFNLHHPPAMIGMGYVTAFYYKALLDAQTMSRAIGQKARAGQYAGRAEAIRDAFNRQLWVQEKGLYRDGMSFVTKATPSEWLPQDRDIVTYTPQVNALAVLYDIAPKARHAAIMDEVLKGAGNIQPYFMHFVFEAMAQAAGFDANAVGQMRRWDAMMAEHPSSLKEMWNSGDYSHAWGGSPGYQMSSKILGIMPMDAGFSNVCIRPQTCGLAWAKGLVPTPMGQVGVEWQRDSRRLAMNISLPKGMKGRLWLPTKGFACPKIAVKAHATELGVDAGYVVYEIASEICEFMVTEE